MLFKRPFLLFSIILTALFLVAIGLIQSPQFANLIKERIAKNVPADLGIETDFKDFRLNVFPPGVSISEPEVTLKSDNALGLPAGSNIRAKRIDFNFYLLQMFTGGFQIEEIAINEGTIRLEVESLEKLLEQSGNNSGEFVWNALKRIRIDSIALLKTRIELIQRDPQWLVQFQADRLSLLQERRRGQMGYRLSTRLSSIESISTHPNNVPAVLDELSLDGGMFPDGVEVSQLSFRSGFGDFQARLNAQGNPLKPETLNTEGRISCQLKLEEIPLPGKIRSKIAPMSGVLSVSSDFGVGPGGIERYWIKSDIGVEDFNGYGYPIDHLKAQMEWRKGSEVPKGELLLSSLSIEGIERERTSVRPGQGGKIVLAEPYRLDFANPMSAGRAKLNLESVHLHWLLGDLSEEVFGLILRATGHIEVLPIQIGKNNLEVRTSVDLKLPYVQFDNQKLGQERPLSRVVRAESVHILGDALLSEEGMALDDVRVDFADSRMLTSGTIDFKKGFDLHWRGRADLSKIETIAESEIAGIGVLSVDLEGALNKPVLSFDFDMDNAEFLDLKLGDVSGLLRYTHEFEQLEFINLKGSKTQATQYVGGGKLQLSDKEDSIKLDIRVLHGQIEHVLEVLEELYKDLDWFPRSIVGLVEGDIRIQGGVDTDSLQVLTQLKGRDWDYLGEKFSIVQMSGGYDKGRFLIEELYARKAQGVLRASLELSKNQQLEWDLQSEDFQLRDIDLIARQDVPLEGGILLRSSGSGPMSHIQSRTEIEIRNFVVKGRRLALGKIEARQDGDRLKLEGGIVDGTLDFDLDMNLASTGSGRLRGNAKRFDFTPLLLLLNSTLYQDRDLRGEVTGSVDISVPTQGWNKLSGEINLEHYTLNKEGLMVSLVSPSILKFENGTASPKELKIKSNQSELISQLSAQNGVLKGLIKGSVDLGIAEIFTGIIKRRDGAMQVDLNLRGTIEKPNLNGKLELLDAAVRIPSVEATLERITALILVNQGVISFQRLEAELGGGRVRGDGKIEFFPDRWPEIEIGINLNENRLRLAPFQFLKLTGRVVLAGTERPYLLSGKVTSSSGLFKQPFLSDAGQLGASSSSIYQPPAVAASGQSTAFLRLKVDAEVPGGVLIKNDLFDAEISGQVSVTNTIESPSIFGKVEVKRGRLLFQDRSFQIQSAKADFDNPAILDPKFTLIGTTEVNDVQIKVFADGRTKRWEAEFSSEPPLPQTEILQLLALGYSTSDLSKLNAQERESVQQTRSAKLVFDALATSLNREALDRWGLEVRIDETDSTTNPSAQSVFSPGATNQGVGGAPKVTLKKQIGKNVNVAGFRTVPGVGQGVQQGLNAEVELPKGFSLQGVYNQLEGVGAAQQGAVNSSNQTTFGVDLKFQRRFKLNW